MGGPLEQSPSSVTVSGPLIPDFSTLKNGLDGGDFQNLAYEFLTNDTEESFKRMSKEYKKLHKSKLNKQKICISTLKLFMKNVPEKPILTIHLTKCKGEM